MAAKTTLPLPIAAGAAVTAFLSAAPVIGLTNFIIPGCWFWAGGMLAAYLVARQTEGLDASSAAVVGFLAAAAGAVLLVLIDCALNFAGVAAAVTRWYFSLLPHDTLKAIEAALGTKPPAGAHGCVGNFVYVALMVWMLAAASCGTLGGALGRQIALKRR